MFLITINYYHFCPRFCADFRAAICIKFYRDTRTAVMAVEVSSPYKPPSNSAGSAGSVCINRCRPGANHQTSNSQSRSVAQRTTLTCVKVELENNGEVPKNGGPPIIKSNDLWFDLRWPPWRFSRRDPYRTLAPTPARRFVNEDIQSTQYCFSYPYA